MQYETLRWHLLIVSSSVCLGTCFDLLFVPTSGLFDSLLMFFLLFVH